MSEILPANTLVECPSWRAAPVAANHPLHGWLTDSASLTARIAARCDALRVVLLSQGDARPHCDEAALLGLRSGEQACLREVLLLADERPVVYARSLLRHDSLRGAWLMFGGIGLRPLGTALFADPLIRRGPLSARRLDRRDTRHALVRQHAGLVSDEALWARRSCFVRHEQPLVVCEVFLPAILALRK
ncbi:chorismate lyase [Uliginosibacterium sp. H3]|uniref:Probable chorismate pyruvate-lyase n=1 Tax=Uliginosibacterium silvisoli TaxID=3114758 RepID=A0ABU6K7E9_9RHOO|nr:chorismate lyase [Uliginosibacterium sp. H3]